MKYNKHKFKILESNFKDRHIYVYIMHNSSTCNCWYLESLIYCISLFRYMIENSSVSCLVSSLSAISFLYFFSFILYSDHFPFPPFLLFLPTATSHLPHPLPIHSSLGQASYGNQQMHGTSS